MVGYGAQQMVEENEKELEEYWRGIIECGSSMMRLEGNDRTSAMNIIDGTVQRILLDIQAELGAKNRRIGLGSGN